MTILWQQLFVSRLINLKIEMIIFLRLYLDIYIIYYLNMEIERALYFSL